MSQAKINFNFNGVNTIIQCKKDDKLKDILKSFKFKEKVEGKSFLYMYNGKTIQNFELSFDEIANFEDKQRCEMNILVVEEVPINPQEEIIKISKNIICPECKEFSRIELIDYKINLYDCKNGHNIDNILLSDFQNTQKIDISQIICHNCKENNKSTTHNNEFYRCINCKCNLCPLCKSIHNNFHYIINYEKQYYICNIHKEFFTQYCDDCELNICSLCENDHKNHTLIKYKDIIPNISEIKQQLNSLRNIIDEANNIIKETINKYNKIIENNEIYYNICKNLIKN
jgi:hypothetical protein